MVILLERNSFCGADCQGYPLGPAGWQPACRRFVKPEGMEYHRRVIRFFAKTVS
jgi:hypothetical protein